MYYFYIIGLKSITLGCLFCLSLIILMFTQANGRLLTSWVHGFYVNAEAKSVKCHLYTLMCSVSVVTVVFIHTMEDDQRLNTLVYEGDALHFSLQHYKT